MNVKQAEKKKKCQQVLWHIFFIFNLMLEPLRFFIIYLHPQFIAHLLLPLISPQAVVQHLLKLRGQGHNNSPCLLRKFLFFDIFFFLFSWILFCFHSCEKVQFYNIWMKYVVTKTSALDPAKLFELYYEMWFWRLQCTELKALTMALVSEGLCIVYKMRSKEERELYPKSVWWKKILYGNQKNMMRVFLPKYSFLPNDVYFPWCDALNALLFLGALFWWKL